MCFHVEWSNIVKSIFHELSRLCTGMNSTKITNRCMWKSSVINCHSNFLKELIHNSSEGCAYSLLRTAKSSHKPVNRFSTYTKEREYAESKQAWQDCIESSFLCLFQKFDEFLIYNLFNVYIKTVIRHFLESIIQRLVYRSLLKIKPALSQPN